MEKVVFFSALLADKPVFGICRGLQLINVLLGGTLYQDLPAELGNSLNHCQRPPYDTPSHSVSLLDSSALHGLLNQDTLHVNSCHHQGVKRLGRRSRSCRPCEDGLVEAACMPDRRFVLQYNGHPGADVSKRPRHCADYPAVCAGLFQRCLAGQIRWESVVTAALKSAVPLLRVFETEHSLRRALPSKRRFLSTFGTTPMSSPLSGRYLSH